MKPEAKSVDVIGFIRNYAIRVLVASLVCGILAAIYSVLFLKDYYTARGQVLVIPPKYMEKIELAPERPGIRTYDSMLNSDEILSGVLGRVLEARRCLNAAALKNWDKTVKDATSAKELLNCSDPTAEWLAGLEKPDIEVLAALDVNETEWRKFEQFRKSFESWFDIDKETNIELIYSPLLKLGADSTNRRMAAIKCNLWMDIFVAQMRQITVAQTKDTVASIINDFEKVSSDLDKADGDIQVFQSKCNTDLLEQEVKAKKEILLGSEQQNLKEEPKEQGLPERQESVLEVVKRALTTGGKEEPVLLPVIVEQQFIGRLLAKEEGILQSLEQEIGCMETKDGAWVGEIETPRDIEKELQDVQAHVRKLTETSERLRKTSFGGPGPEVAGSPEDVTRESIQPALVTLLAKKAYIEANLRLADFARATRVDSALERERALKKTFGVLSEAGLVESVSAAAYAQQVSNLRDSLREISKTVRYRDSLPVDVLLPALNINPTAAGVVGLASVELEREEENPEYYEMARNLTASISRAGLAQARTDAISGSLDKYAGLLADVTAENIILQAGLDLLTDAKNLAQARLDAVREQYRRSQRNRLETLVRIGRLRGIHRTLSLESAGLIEDISKTENLLTGWKVTLTQLERRQATLQDSYDVMAERIKEARLQATAAPEDVRVAARAVVPDRKTGPYRSLIVLATLVFSFLFFILASMVWEFVIRKPENA